MKENKITIINVFVGNDETLSHADLSEMAWIFERKGGYVGAKIAALKSVAGCSP